MIALHNQPTVLDITRVSDIQYRFIILEPGQPYFGPMQQIFDIRVHPAILNGLGKMIVDSAQKSNVEGELPGDSFKNCGELLYEQIFPARGGAQSLVDKLSKLETPLLICTDDPKIFWELAHDGENFLGLKYITGRRLKKSAVPVAIPKKEEHWRCLLISNPTLDLPNTEQETLKLSETLKRKGVTCDHLSGSEANLVNVLIHLKKEYDIIHYAGHIGLDESVEEYAFYLADRETLWASNIRNQLKGSPIVFLNGCWSAANVKSHTDTLYSVESLTDAFLEAGAQLVIGSLFEVPDEGARVFAEIFYDHVLKGEMVGEALRQARLQTIESKKYGAAWACFVMYGDPCLQVEFKQDETEILLNSIGLTRKDFEISTLRIFEQAKEYGRLSGGISSAHLFVAMLSEKDSELGDILKLQQIPPEYLKKGFQSLFKLVNEVVGEEQSEEKITCSENVTAILLCAEKIAVKEEREKISATDLILLCQVRL